MEINGRSESDRFFEDMLQDFWKRGNATWLGFGKNPCKKDDNKHVDILELHNAIHNYKEQAKRDHKENELLSQELGREKLLNKSLEEEVGMLNDTESGDLFDAKRNLKIIRKVCAKREEENKILGDKLDYEAALRGKREKEINLLHGDIVNENNEVKALIHRNELLAKENWEIIEKLRAVESVWQTRLQEKEKNVTGVIDHLKRDKALLYRELKLMSELLEDREKSATNRTSASEDEVVRLRKVLEDVKAQLSYAVAQRDYAEKEMKKDKEPLYNEFERVTTMLHSEEEANDRLEEVDRLKGVLEDKVGLLSWHIVQRGLHSRKYESLMETNKLLQEQIEVLQEAIYGRDKKWGIQ